MASLLHKFRIEFASVEIVVGLDGDPSPERYVLLRVFWNVLIQLSSYSRQRMLDFLADDQQFTVNIHLYRVV